MASVSTAPSGVPGLLRSSYPTNVDKQLFRAVYVFIGCILLSDNVLRIIAGSIVGIIGVAYVVLEFIPQIEPPANMREADAGWGAEQV